MIAGRAQGVDLLGGHTKDQDVFAAGMLADFNIRAVKRTERDRAVEHQLHIAGAACLGPRQRDLLGDFAGRHQQLGDCDAVIFQKYNAQLIAYSRIALNHIAQSADELDDLFGQKVSGRGLRAEDIRLWHKRRVWIILKPKILCQDMQRIEMLPLIFVQALDLHIKDGIGVERNAGSVKHIFGETLLVFLLNSGKPFERLFIAGEPFETAQMRHIVQPAVADGVKQKLCQPGVGLVKPAA